MGGVDGIQRCTPQHLDQRLPAVNPNQVGVAIAEAHVRVLKESKEQGDAGFLGKRNASPPYMQRKSERRQQISGNGEQLL